MRSLVTLAVSLGCVLAGAARAAAQEPAPKEELVEQVRQAIERGERFLRQQEGGKGHWETGGPNMVAVMAQGGFSCLAMLALMNAGVPPDDPVIQRGLAWQRQQQFGQTYVVGLQTMVYAEAGYAEDKPRIQQNVNWLIRAMSGRGPGFRGWSYTERAGGNADNSNSQYALLGLWAAKNAGVDVPADVWRDIREFYIRTQQQDGGWFYDQHRQVTTLTMTMAGFCNLLIAGMELNKGQQELLPDGTARRCGFYAENEPLARALRFIGSDRNFTLRPRAHQFYNIYGIERAGRLSGRRFLGGHDWYREGCDLLVKMQQRDGSWMVSGQLTDGWPVVSTSFALLFLAKGRTPVLISKFATGPVNGEDWNRKHHDVRHLVEFASRELFRKTPLAWQVYDARLLDNPNQETVRREASELLVSPVVFMNGHEKPALTDLQKQILKKYLEEGGFLFAEACCGAPAFKQGFKELMEELFPDAPLRPLPPEHPIWHSAFAVPPTEFPELMGIDMGCKTVVVFSPQPLAGWYEENRWDRQAFGNTKGPMAFRLAGNVIAYATGLEVPKPKLSKVDLPEEGAGTLRVKRGFLKAAQLRHEGDWQPAPRAMRNLLLNLGSKDQLDVALQTEPLRPLSPDLYQFKFLYLHGRGQFAYTPAECEALRADLKTGGLLFADACCGKKAFDGAFRAFAKQLFPGQELQRVPLDDPLFSAELNGAAITTVRCRRERADGSGPEPEFRTVAPLLEGIKYNGRWVVIYSRYDIGCALEKHQSSDCLGHDHDSAVRLGRAAVLYMLKQ